jgi:Peptidase family U32
MALTNARLSSSLQAGSDIKKIVELISPAGDMTSLITALKAGADAVYFGAEGYNMRAGSSNFNSADFPVVRDLCNKYEAKAYLALNTIVYDGELKKMTRTVTAARTAGIDAVICSDMAVIEACRKIGMPFHISTQASVSNYSAVQFYASLGAKMIVLARELTCAISLEKSGPMGLLCVSSALFMARCVLPFQGAALCRRSFSVDRQTAGNVCSLAEDSTLLLIRKRTRSLSLALIM